VLTVAEIQACSAVCSTGIVDIISLQVEEGFDLDEAHQ
jgi:hypothetical protein